MVKIVTKGNSSPVLTYLQKQEAQKEVCSANCLQPSSRQLHTMGSDICGRQLTETQLRSTCAFTLKVVS